MVEFDANTIEITELTPEQVQALSPERFLRGLAKGPVGPVPAGQKFAILAVALAPGVLPIHRADIVAAIEGITGVQKAVITHAGKAPAVLPADNELYLGITPSVALVRTEPEA